MQLALAIMVKSTVILTGAQKLILTSSDGHCGNNGWENFLVIFFSDDIKESLNDFKRRNRTTAVQKRMISSGIT